jgi:hypothetical protein
MGDAMTSAAIFILGAWAGVFASLLVMAGCVRADDGSHVTPGGAPSWLPVETLAAEIDRIVAERESVIGAAPPPRVHFFDADGIAENGMPYVDLPTGRVAGFFDDAWYYIGLPVVPGADPLAVLPHEVTHYLLWSVRGDADRGHTMEVW